ncbi:unnamed protein product [Amaranthus hypochondriacus]
MEGKETEIREELMAVKQQLVDLQKHLFNTENQKKDSNRAVLEKTIPEEATQLEVEEEFPLLGSNQKAGQSVSVAPMPQLTLWKDKGIESKAVYTSATDEMPKLDLHNTNRAASSDGALDSNTPVDVQQRTEAADAADVHQQMAAVDTGVQTGGQNNTEEEGWTPVHPSKVARRPGQQRHSYSRSLEGLDTQSDQIQNMEERSSVASTKFIRGGNPQIPSDQ